jgi:hypothetical protein
MNIQPEPTSILEENWDIPQAKPVPGKPIHNAQQPTRSQTTRRAPGQPGYIASQQSAGNQAPVGNGVRRTTYQR